MKTLCKSCVNCLPSDSEDATIPTQVGSVTVDKMPPGDYCSILKAKLWWVCECGSYKRKQRRSVYVYQIKLPDGVEPNGTFERPYPTIEKALDSVPEHINTDFKVMDFNYKPD